MRARVEASLLQAFREEFQTDLALLRQQWGAFQPNAQTSVDDLPELRRCLHTIKGSTRLLGFDGIPEKVHHLEEAVLAALKERAKPLSLWDDLADLEEAVARFIGHQDEVSLEVTPESEAPTLGHSRVSESSSYRFLMAIDELLGLSSDLASELTADDGDEESPSGPAPTAYRDRLSDQARLLVERARTLREEARRQTMVRSSELFAGLTELARRAATDQHKRVHVTHQVESDLLEREIVLSLRPALLHLTQNAVTHGVGQDHGQIRFGYRRLPSELLICVSDQGDGLSRDAIRKAVLASGHLSQPEWEKLGEQEQLHWVFRSGVSTRSEADLSAGRGMGLAVVAETVERLGGRVEIESSSQGSEFRMRIPAHWNLRSVLKVRSGAKTLAVLSGDLVGVEASSLDRTRERNVPYLGALCALLGYPGPVGEAPYRLLIKHLEFGQQAIGVDEISDFDDIMVTPIDQVGGLPKALVGSSIVRGRTLLVVSLSALLDAPLPNRTIVAPPSVERDAPLLLVVDDSVTTRTLVSGILRSEGYRVVVASDGRHGLELAATPGLDLIISDLQMPVMNGFELLEHLRAGSNTQHLPFILLTSIDDVASFEKASALGADRCLGKQNFTQDLLLQTVRELL